MTYVKIKLILPRLPVQRHICANLILVVMAAGCSLATKASQADTHDSVLLRHLIADADSVPMPPSVGHLSAVDPRPLRRREEPGDSAEPWFATVDSAAVAQRTAVILGAGVDTARALDLTRCPGRWYRDRPHRGCPDTATSVVAFGRLPAGATQGDTATWIVRVQWFEADSRGLIIREYRYRLRWEQGAWRTEARTQIGQIDA